MENEVEFLKGYNGDDFKNDRISFRIKYKKLVVLINCKQRNYSISIDLYDRFIDYKALKIFKRLMEAYPLGGNLKYYIH